MHLMLSEHYTTAEAHTIYSLSQGEIPDEVCLSPKCHFLTKINARAVYHASVLHREL